MDVETRFKVITKILEVCGCNKESAIYSFLVEPEKIHSRFSQTYFSSINNIPNLIESILEIFCKKKTDIAKNSYEFQKIKENQETVVQLIDKYKGLSDLQTIIPNDNKTEIALVMISSIYFESFIRPVQFFLPRSSACSGQWDFWERNNYFKFLEKINEKRFTFESREKIIKSKIWDIKFEPEDFPEIIKRRLVKEKAFEKKLDPTAMIKAMIIRMGEMARPNINYEVIDYLIRSFFTYLSNKKYIRVDREIKFLRMFEKEIVGIVKNGN